MTLSEFEQLVSEIGFSPVPERFRGLISNVALCVEDDVSDELRRDMALPDNETLLGLYRGIPLTARGDNYGIAGALPDTITIFRLPILEAAAEDGMSVRQMTEETIWHELAHHFGLDEGAVRRRERERA
jgi:predicted Zn-dependent protease with MMP-like domain